VNDIQIDRLIAAAERFSLAWEKIATIQQRRYPEPVEAEDAEVWRVGDAQKEPNSKAEYRDFPGDSRGKFQTIIEAAHAAAPKR
jgi:hypothetical protein